MRTITTWKRTVWQTGTIKFSSLEAERAGQGVTWWLCSEEVNVICTTGSNRPVLIKSSRNRAEGWFSCSHIRGKMTNWGARDWKGDGDTINTKLSSNTKTKSKQNLGNIGCSTYINWSVDCIIQERVSQLDIKIWKTTLTASVLSQQTQLSCEIHLKSTRWHNNTYSNRFLTREYQSCVTAEHLIELYSKCTCVIRWKLLSQRHRRRSRLHWSCRFRGLKGSIRVRAPEKKKITVSKMSISINVWYPITKRKLISCFWETYCVHFQRSVFYHIILENNNPQATICV